MPPLRPILVAFAALVLPAGGCDLARTSLTFRTVDAATGRPLAGVEANGREKLEDILFGSKSRALTLPRSDAEGLIHAEDLHASWYQSFWFDSPGYLRAQALTTNTAARGRVMLIDLPPTDPRSFPTGPYGLIQKQFAEPRDGIIEIKMYPGREGDSRGCVTPNAAGWRVGASSGPRSEGSTFTRMYSFLAVEPQ